MNSVIITDPFFYAVAIPAVLLLGLSKSGFGAGFGALAVPLMALAVPVPQAAALLMPLLLVMDLQGIAVFKNHKNNDFLKLTIPFGLLGTVLGFLLFKILSANGVAGIVGILTLLFLAQKLAFPPQAQAPSSSGHRALGAVLATTSGFTSFVAHAGGPPIQAYAIPLRMPPLVFTATMSYQFFVINLSKWIPYAFLGLLDWRNAMTSLVLMPLAPIGVTIGVKIAKIIPMDLFYRLVYLGMFLTGIKLIYDGFFNRLYPPNPSAGDVFIFQAMRL